MSVSPQAKNDPKPYVSPALTVHGDVGAVTSNIKQGAGNRDNVPNPSYKTQ
jgi:hypothetical protein